MDNSQITKLEGISTEGTLKPVGITIFRQLDTQYQEMVNSYKTRPHAVKSIIEKNKMDFAIMVELSHLMIATGVNEGQQFSQLAYAIGQRVANFYNLRIQNNNAIHLGAFIINAYSILDLVIIKLVQSLGKYQTTYNVYAGNKGKLQQLKKEFDEKSDPYKPLLEQAPNWEHGTLKNSLGEPIKLIKDANIDTLAQVNINNTPVVLNAINKKQKIAYYVKPEIFEVYKWALLSENDDKSIGQSCFEHNSVDTIEIDRKIAKKAEATAVMEATEPFVGKKFFQQYTADNRGRLYPLSAYLNELNSDNAKGMLSFYEGKPLGSTGLAQLKHHIANMFGKDKLPHQERVDFVTDNYDLFVSYGMNPYKNIGWMEAEEPFQFLNAVMELYNFDTWIKNGNGTEEEFVSHTICYRDGSNNGLQWLFSLAGDDKHAHLVNVKPTNDGKPGDMYSHVAEAVVEEIYDKKDNNNFYILTYDYKNYRLISNHIYTKVRKLQRLIKSEKKRLSVIGQKDSPKLSFLRKLLLKKSLISKKYTNRYKDVSYLNYDLFFRTIEKLRNDCRNTELKYGMKNEISERKRKFVRRYQNRYKPELETTDLLYWDKAKSNQFDSKTWRKVVKRNVMTYGYSATKQGMGEQIIQDTRDIDNVYLSNKQHSAARLLGSMVYSTIENEFPLVSATMKLFKDNCGLYMKETGKQYKHTTPISNFPFVQHYMKQKTSRLAVKGVYITSPDYESKSFEDIFINARMTTNEPNVQKAKAGISPNTIHNLDSLHLMLVINECDFDIVSAHDSYGGHASDIVEMQKVIREQFKRIIDLDPIKNILDQTGNLVPAPEKGSLDSAEILNSEFAFS